MLMSSTAGHAAGNVDAGRKLFGQCAACHAVGKTAGHQFGPMLNGVMERPAASADGYSYSDALKQAAQNGLVWDEPSLDAFLESPMTYVVGTKMAFAGMRDEAQRQDMIAFLQQIDSSGSGATATVEPPAANSLVSESSAPEAQRPLARDTTVPEHGVLHLGRLALPEEVAAWDIDIRPDGLGLPTGSGSVETGGQIYDAQCAVCHGVFGEGAGRWPVLAGGFDTLSDERPEKTIGSYWPYVSTVYDYVRRAMPFGNARSLSDDDVYALTAYLLYLNDQVSEDFTLSTDNFASITLPNVDNFIADDRMEEVHYASREEPCMQDCIPGEATVTQRARVLDVTPDNGDDDNAGGGID
ncbi:MAG: c-type cytochrome [Granulosicoccus sp.]|nr:c-type cytochrome [Granulosicoccus sp.]